MKARIGFVLFISVFLVAAIVAPLVDLIVCFPKQMLQYFLNVQERFARSVRFAAKKISTVEWKSFIQKVS